MKNFLRNVGHFVHQKVTGAQAPAEFLPALATLTSIMIISVFFFHRVEGWSYLDATYFSVMTVTTVGYGDLHPTNDVSKIFTMFLVLFGAGLGIYIISTFAASLMEGRKKRLSVIEKIFKND